MADPRIGKSRIPEYLKRINMTQAEFARRIDVSEAYVSKVIKTRKNLSLAKSKRAADLFNCHIEDLYIWEYSE